MKKLLWITICLMMVALATSCKCAYVASVNYDVCYPDGTQNVNDTAVIASFGMPTIICMSYGGTNYVSAFTSDINIATYKPKNVESVIFSSTAPVRLNNYSVKKIKKNKKLNDDMY